MQLPDDRGATGRALRGALAGAAGTAALELAAPLERAVAGGGLPFQPAAIAGALCHRLGLRPRAGARARFGRLLRWSYGPGWGALYGGFRRRLPRRRAARVAALGGAILALELATLPPLVGRRLMRGRVLGALGLHVALFALVVEGALGAVERRR